MSLFLCLSLHLHPARLLPLHTTFHVASMHAVCCLPLTACSREHTSWTSIHRSGSSPLHSLVSSPSKLRATMTRMLCSLVPMACFVLFCTRPSQKAFFFFFCFLCLVSSQINRQQRGPLATTANLPLTPLAKVWLLCVLIVWLRACLINLRCRHFAVFCSIKYPCPSIDACRVSTRRSVCCTSGDICSLWCGNGCHGASGRVQ